MSRPTPPWSPMLSVAIVAALVGLPTLAGALGTTLWRVDSVEQLEQGELEDVTVSSLGEVALGRSASRVPLEDVALVWSLAEEPDGAVLLGTGNNGKLLRLRGTKVDEVVRLEAIAVSALALGEGGAVYAGTVPGSKIYRIERGTKGASRAVVFAELDRVEHVWALAWDPRRGVLFAGTGPEGLVYAVDRSGRPSVSPLGSWPPPERPTPLPGPCSAAPWPSRR